MNLFGLIKNWNRSFVFCIILAAFVFTISTNALSQKQKIDKEYTDLIHKFTTEPFFVTKYVDYLPYSKDVPTPKDVLGHIVGAADVLSYSHEIYQYMRALEKASPRVKVETIGMTEEGREMIVVIISDDATISNLDKYKKINAKLADPRNISDKEAQELIKEAKPIYYATGAMHATETGSPEMLMELAYRLAVDEGEFVKSIRDNMIIMLTPLLEVDGRDKVVDLAMAPRIDKDSAYPARPLYWGKYVAHDNNRDGIGMSLKMTQHVIGVFLDFHPQVIHDLHESASHFYTSTGTGPYNAWLDPILIDEWYKLAYEEVTELTKEGVPGVWTYGFYDGWAPNYMFYIANGHNSIGRFYETQGAGDGSTKVITNTVSRVWYKPNPPLAKTLWSIRNNVNMQQAAILVAMNYMSRNAVSFMDNFYVKSKRSVAKATNEGPAAYVFPASESRKGLQADLLNLLKIQGVEIHKAKKDFSTEEGDFKEGSYIVRMDQPYSRTADMYLDKQYYSVNDPRPYDDVGWTLGPLFNVKTVRVKDTNILSASMSLENDRIKSDSGLNNLTGGSSTAYIINHNADNALATFRYANKDLVMNAAEASFEVEGMSFNLGSFIINKSDNSGNLENLLKAASDTYGFKVYGVSAAPEVSVHKTVAARTAILHTWTSTQAEGWVRIEFDRLGIPYDYISVHDIRDNNNLRSKYDVIVMGPSSTNVLSIVNGLPKSGKKVAWKKSELTPNIGRQAETDDMRGGMELEGVVNLKNFIEQGGVFLAITSSSSLPIYFGLAPGVTIKPTPNLWARGGIFAAEVADLESPIAYGYDKEMGVYFNTAPVFNVGGGGGNRFRRRGPPVKPEPGSTKGSRPSGRGGIKDKDIIQGRAEEMGVAVAEAFSESKKAEEGNNPIPISPTAPKPRTILKFTKNVEDLLISGGLDNGQELTDAAAVVDAKLGEGHVVMFGINPMWRHQTYGTFMMVFNTLMNYDNLDAGEEKPKAEDKN